jgi:hypothetical protein
MQFAAVVLDKPPLVVSKRPIQMYCSKKMLAGTGKFIHFVFDPHCLPFSGNFYVAGFAYGRR